MLGIAARPLRAQDHRVNALLEDRAGLLWVGTRVGFGRFDRAKERFRNYAVAVVVAGNRLFPTAMTGTSLRPDGRSNRYFRV